MLARCFRRPASRMSFHPRAGISAGELAWRPRFPPLSRQFGGRSVYVGFLVSGNAFVPFRMGDPVERCDAIRRNAAAIRPRRCCLPSATIRTSGPNLCGFCHHILPSFNLTARVGVLRHPSFSYSAAANLPKTFGRTGTTTQSCTGCDVSLKRTDPFILQPITLPESVAPTTLAR